MRPRPFRFASKIFLTLIVHCVRSEFMCDRIACVCECACDADRHFDCSARVCVWTRDGPQSVWVHASYASYSYTHFVFDLESLPCRAESETMRQPTHSGIVIQCRIKSTRKVTVIVANKTEWRWKCMFRQRKARSSRAIHREQNNKIAKKNGNCDRSNTDDGSCNYVVQLLSALIFIM